MNEQNSFFKTFSVFLIGLILGFSISKIHFAPASNNNVPGKSSVKMMGNENAKVTITEYSDFQCPFCHQYFANTYPLIVKNYVETGKVKYVFKHFPLSFHPQAPAAANASECALEQGKFWEMHNLLYQKQDQWSGNPDHLQIFKTLATSLNLDSNKFNQCLDSKTYQKNLDLDFQEGLSKGFSGTPSFAINDQILIGSQDSQVFIDTIEKLLK